MLELETTLNNSFKAVSWGNFALQLMLAQGLKYLWSMVNILQFAAYFPLWQLNYSFEVKSFLKNIKLLVLMEFLPTEGITDQLSEWFGLS